MSESFSLSYKAVGVDVTAGYKAVELMKSHIARTKIPGVLSSVGGFGGLFEPDLSTIKNPVLVSGTDGVGTKLKIAFFMDKHDTVGRDCVAMCVNDIVCSGARPQIFLDYIACGKNVPERVSDIVKGIADGCVIAGCALVGGETAEMPGFYPEDEYDLAGFSVGVVDKSKIIDGSLIKKGDIIVGLASSGVHSNGYSLVRKVFNLNSETVNMKYDDLSTSLGEELLKPTRIYVRSVLSLMEKIRIKAISHITGGGFYENIPRMLADNMSARIDKGSFPTPAIFDIISRTGNISERDMYNTFNMGIGMMLVFSKDDAAKAVEYLEEYGEQAFIIGEITDGEKGVLLC